MHAEALEAAEKDAGGHALQPAEKEKKPALQAHCRGDTAEVAAVVEASGQGAHAPTEVAPKPVR